MSRTHRSAVDFDGFFATEFPQIARTAWYVVLDTEVAKEIAQEAFCRALQRWDRISRYDRPGAWVRTVAIRLAVRSRDLRRREARLAAVERPSPGEIDTPVLDNATLAAALATLPRQQRAAVVLRYLCDLDIDELAAEIGCKPATARVHLHRGRQALGQLLGVHDDVA